MKKKNFTLIVLLVSLIGFSLSGCMGKDGLDGEAYISFDWDWYTDSYVDSNIDTPSQISQNVYYQTRPGNYSYEIDCSDGDGNSWSFTGTYSITINKGEKGEFLQDGQDGADKYYDFYLSGIDGLEVTHNKDVKVSSTPNNKKKKDNLDKTHKNMTGQTNEAINTRFYHIGNVIIKVTSQKHIFH